MVKNIFLVLPTVTAPYYYNEEGAKVAETVQDESVLKSTYSSLASALVSLLDNMKYFIIGLITVSISILGLALILGGDRERERAKTAAPWIIVISVILFALIAYASKVSGG